MTTFRRAIFRNDPASYTISELEDIVYWLRQFFSMIIGLIFGLLHVKGFNAIIIYFILSLYIINFYLFTYLRLDEKKFEATEISTEGFKNGTAIFFLIWITMYSI